MSVEPGIDRTLVHAGDGMYIIPRRDFPDEDAYVDFVERMLEYHSVAQEPAAA